MPDSQGVTCTPEQATAVLAHLLGVGVEIAGFPAPAPSERSDEVAELHDLNDKLSNILTRSVNALRGEPPPGTLWSWHDLPDRIAAAMCALKGAMELAASPAPAHPDPDHIAGLSKMVDGAHAWADKLANAIAAADAFWDGLNAQVAAKVSLQEKPAELTDDEIREIFLANGFTLKDGSDLKPYVYKAARALLDAAMLRSTGEKG